MYKFSQFNPKYYHVHCAITNTYNQNCNLNFSLKYITMNLVEEARIEEKVEERYILGNKIEKQI